jgi:four helix bundle protein
MSRLENVPVLEEGRKLAAELDQLVNECQNLELKYLLQDTAESIPANIAEGFERQSDKAFEQYLFIAKCSCGDLRTQLLVAIESGEVDKPTGLDLIERTRKISATLYHLIKQRKEVS